MQATSGVTYLAQFAKMLAVGARRYNNVSPRTMKLGGLALRAQAAHENGFEAFPVFAAAAASSMVCGVRGDTASRYCTAHAALRLLFTLWYILLNKGKGTASVRSLLWLASQYCSYRLLVLAANAKHARDRDDHDHDHA